MVPLEPGDMETPGLGRHIVKSNDSLMNAGLLFMVIADVDDKV
jgi:hypothetical protein